MGIQLTPPCTNCKKRKFINPFAELPAMVGFQLEDGSVINMCSDCLMKLGEMTDEEKDMFIERIGENNE